MTNPVLQRLVEMRGIETHYTDAWGKPAAISESSQAKLLNVLGYDTSNELALEEQLKAEATKIWQTPLNPVQVLRQSEPLAFSIRLPIELVTDTYTVNLNTEDGQTFVHSFVPVDETLAHVAQLDEVEFHEYIIALPFDVPLGYHELALLVEGDEEPLCAMRIIMAPAKCFIPESIEKGKKIWGLSVQLYCVRSEKNWGMGDFSDLASLTAKAAETGAEFIGLNPIHALYPANPDACSPYGPSSRRWLNYLYLDVTAMPCYDDGSVQAIVNAEEFQQKLDAARATDFVDYAAVAELKLPALTAVFDVYYETYLKKNTKQSREFKAFVEAGGESLDMLAVYDTLQEKLAEDGKPSWGWPVFPDEFSEYHKPGVEAFRKKNKKRVTFFMFLQWQAAIQLQAASDVATASGMSVGLYRDLAVGHSQVKPCSAAA